MFLGSQACQGRWSRAEHVLVIRGWVGEQVCLGRQVRAGWWGQALVGRARATLHPPGADPGLLLPAQESYKYFPSSVSPAPPGQGGACGQVIQGQS